MVAVSVSLALVAAVQQAGAQDARAQNAGARSAGATGAVADSARGRCTAREIGRSTLRADSLELYVEPSVLSVSGDEMLLAGKPVYAWRRTSTGAAEYVERDDILGAVIARDGSARIVTAPVAHGDRLMGLRAAPHRGGGWDVVFAELSAPYHNGSDTGVVKLWHGVYRERAWGNVEPVPVPDTLVPLPFDASALVSAHDTLMWAMDAVIRGAFAQARDILVLQHAGDAWWSTRITPGVLSNARAAYASRTGFVLGIAHPDQRAVIPGGPMISASLMLYARERDDWRFFDKAAKGDSLNVYLQSMVGAGDRLLLTWLVYAGGRMGARKEVRAKVWRASSPDSSWTVVYPDVNYVAPPVVLDDTPVWVVESVSEGLLEPSRELHLVALDTSYAAKLLTQFPNPFRGFFAVATPAPEDIWIAGPVKGRTGADPVVVTLLLRVRIECRRDLR